jgi:hypothetical protein
MLVLNGGYMNLTDINADTATPYPIKIGYSCVKYIYINMDGWMCGCVGGWWMDERVNGCVGGRMGGWMDGWAGGWVAGWMDVGMCVCVYVCMYIYLYVCTYV